MARLPDRFKGKPNRYLTGSVDRIRKFILDYDKSYFESLYPGSFEHITSKTAAAMTAPLNISQNPFVLGNLIGENTVKTDTPTESKIISAIPQKPTSEATKDVVSLVKSAVDLELQSAGVQPSGTPGTSGSTTAPTTPATTSAESYTESHSDSEADSKTKQATVTEYDSGSDSEE